jgi:ribonuclease HI
MDQLHLFTDGSVNPQSKIGFGAYLVLSDLSKTIDSVKNTVKLKNFEKTSSTKLEVQTLLWALNEILALRSGSNFTLTIYTDCQNIIGLPGRRTHLEEANYFSSKNKRLNNYELYREFYQLTSKLKIEFVKVVGHQASSKKNKIDQLFELVDRASRSALRKEF